MKILIDECLPAALKRSFTPYGHVCATVREAGFGSKKNGELLALAEGVWDTLLTSDKNMKYQQNLAGRNISILVVRAQSNRVADLLPLLDACIEALQRIQPGQVIEVSR